MLVSTYNFDLRAVCQLLDRVNILCVVLQQNGHLKGGGLWGREGDHTEV